MKMEETECFETSAYKIQTPGNYPEENIEHLQHGESLKSRIHRQHKNNLEKCGPCPIFAGRAPSLQNVKIWKNIWPSSDGASWCILIMKANKMHYFSYLFDKELYMFRTDPLAASRQPTELAWQIPTACIQCRDTPDDGQWTCPKHVEYFIK
jgi:hypothetical protein